MTTHKGLGSLLGLAWMVLASACGGGGSGNGDVTAAAPTFFKAYSGSGIDSANGTAVTPDGGYLMVGVHGARVAGSGQPAWEALGGELLIAKVDASGDPLWQRVLGEPSVGGGPRAPHYHYARATTDGGLVLVGQSEPAAATGTDIVVARLAADGSVQWRREFDSGAWFDYPYAGVGEQGRGEFADDIGLDVWPLQDGGLLVSALSTADLMVPDVGVGTTRRHLDAVSTVVLRLDDQGNLLWQRRLAPDERRARPLLPVAGVRSALVREASNGDAILLTASSFYGYSRNTRLHLYRFDHQGEQLFHVTEDALTTPDAPQALDLEAGVSILVGSSDSQRSVIMGVGPQGDRLWTNTEDDFQVTGVRRICDELDCRVFAFGQTDGQGRILEYNQDGDLQATYPVSGTQRILDLRRRAAGGYTLLGIAWRHLQIELFELGPQLQAADTGLPLTGVAYTSVGLLTADGTSVLLDNARDAVWRHGAGGEFAQRVDLTPRHPRTAAHAAVALGADDVVVAGFIDYRLWLGRLRSGEMVWQQFINLDHGGQPLKLVATSDDGLVLATDSVVARFDAVSGALDWSLDFLSYDFWSLGVDRIIDVSAAADRLHILLKGGEAGRPDFVVAQTTLLGDLAAGYLRRYHAGGLQPRALADDGEGGVVVIGEARGNEALAQAVRLDGEGEPVWSYRYRHGFVAPKRFGIKLARAADGSGYLAAFSGASRDVGGDLNAMLLRLDAAGQAQWLQELGAGRDEGVHSLTATADGGFLVGGETQSFLAPPAGWLLRVGANGTISAGCQAEFYRSIAVETLGVSVTGEFLTVPDLARLPVELQPAAVTAREGGPVDVARACAGTASSGDPGAGSELAVEIVYSGDSPGRDAIFSTPGGILCGADDLRGCSARFASGSRVVLEAAAWTNFRRWGPGCESAEGPRCEVRLDRAQSIRAYFGGAEGLPERRLTLDLVGNGFVRDGNATLCSIGEAASERCTFSYAPDSQLSLEAVANGTDSFIAWEGDCAGSGPQVALSMDVDKSCTARFTESRVPPVTLSVYIVGIGEVNSQPAGIACYNTTGHLVLGQCSADFSAGSTVTLTATPASGWRFQRWAGPNCDHLGDAATVELTIDPGFADGSGGCQAYFDQRN